MSNKYVKLGTLMRDKENPDRMYIILGDKSEKYGFNAQVAAFKGKKGSDDMQVLAKQDNGFLSVFPPKNENAPSTVVGDICIKLNDEE